MLKKMFSRLSFSDGVLFAVLWLMVGLSTGMSIILGPIHWAAAFVQTYQLEQWVEDTLAKIIIVLYVLLSAWIAFWLCRLYRNAKATHVRFVILACPFIFGAGATWLLLSPTALSFAQSNISIYNAQVTVGGYPNKQMLAELKKQGYTIISLLSDDFPLDKYWLEQERENASALDIELIHMPMLPWIEAEKNKQVIKKITDLVNNSSKRYYIHCYLGQDRTRFITRTFEKLLPDSKKVVLLTLPRGLANIRDSLNGPIISLGNGIYVGPNTHVVPDKVDHFLNFYGANSDLKEIVLLYDVHNETEKAWYATQAKFLSSYLVSVHSFIVPQNGYDPEQLLKIAQRIKQLERPVFINVPSMDSARADALIQALRNDLPPLSAQAFSEPMVNGRVGVIAPNVAVGPRPANKEWISYLYFRGIDSFVYVGDRNTPEAIEDAKIAQKSKLNWHAVDGKNLSVSDTISKDRTWYFYGPKLNYGGLSRLKNLHNGAIMQLDPQVYLAPNPTDTELSRYWLDGYIKQVVIVVESDQKSEWLDRERKLLSERGIQSEVVELPVKYDPKLMLQLARKVWSLPQPIIVQFANPDAPIAQAFIEAFRVNVLPLLASTITTSLKNGRVTLLAPNVAIGPRPDLEEFKSLSSQGIYRFYYLGQRTTQEHREDKKIAADAGVDLKAKWEKGDKDFLFYNIIATGGPWYLYGPDLDQMYQEDLREVLGPVMPSTIVRYPESRNRSGLDNMDETSSGWGAAVYCHNCTTKALPDWGRVALLSPWFALYILFSAAFVGWLRTVKQLPAEYTRRIFHLLIFTFAGVLQIIWHQPMVTLFGIIVFFSLFYIIFRNNNFPVFEALTRPNDQPDRELFIIAPLIAAIMGIYLGNMWFGSFAAIGILVCGWGAAVGEPVSLRWGKHRYIIPTLYGTPIIKTVEGSVTVILVSTLVGIVSLLVLGYPMVDALWIGAIAGAVGGIVGAVSYYGLENLTIQLAATATAYFIIQWSGSVPN